MDLDKSNLSQDCLDTTNKVKTFTHLPTVEAQMAWTEKSLNFLIEFKLTTSGIVDLN